MDLLLLWPFIGLVAGVPVILELCKPQEYYLGAHTRRQSPWKSLINDQSWWMRAALPMYLLHQFEEHGYDFMGRRYAFRSHFCDHLVSSPSLLLVFLSFFFHAQDFNCRKHILTNTCPKIRASKTLKSVR